MSDNSTINGYLQPSGAGPAQDAALDDVIQAWIVGITALPGPMVRPSWQGEPPNIPDAGVVWMAFGIGNVDGDVFPYVGHAPLGDGSDNLQMHERMDVVVSCYDLGSGGQADKFAAILRDGANIEQNAFQLKPAGMALVAVGSLLTVPILFKQRWQYRVDLPIRIARQIDRTYPVVSITSMTGELRTDVGIPPRALTVPHP